MCATVLTMLRDDELNISEVLLATVVEVQIVRVCENLLKALAGVVVLVNTWSK